MIRRLLRSSRGEKRRRGRGVEANPRRHGAARTTEKKRRRLPIALRADRQTVVNFADSRRRPGGAFRFLSFGPRLYRSSQDHLAAVGFHRDAARINFGTAAEGVFDFAANLEWRHCRFQCYRVGYRLDSTDAAHGAFSPLTRIVPFNGPFESQPAILGDDLYVLGGIRQFRLQRTDGIANDVRVRPLVDHGQPYFDVIRDTRDASHALRVALRLSSLGVATYES